MNHLLASTLLMLLLSSANAFSTVSRTASISQNSRFHHSTLFQKNVIQSKRPSTSLDMSAAAITGAITGGLFAGGLHAIAGKLKP
jgi:hypothetical protein